MNEHVEKQRQDEECYLLGEGGGIGKQGEKQGYSGEGETAEDSFSVCYEGYLRNICLILFISF